MIVDFRSKLAEIVQVYTPYELDSHNRSEEISVANVPSLASKNGPLGANSSHKMQLPRKF